MAATIAYLSQPAGVSSRKHAACDECRTRIRAKSEPTDDADQCIGGRKLKCSGDTPQCRRCGTHHLACHYSDQKPMGRPRKRRHSNPSEDQDMPDIQPDFVDGISEPWLTSGDTMQINEVHPFTSPWPTYGDSPLSHFTEPGPEPISIRTPKPLPMPEIDFSDRQPPDFSIPSPFT